MGRAGAERRRAGARGAQAGRRQRARQAQACAGRAAWARGVGVPVRAAGRAGWSAGLVLVHSAPGSVLTQLSVPFDSVFS